ncbi:MAG: hypothetical protein KVP17_002369 [Porospora cf. gigantea B]|uniref:uncharacterized protein n=1 Tax=Porospora cf. gigantea B TaxID=2853592 RepID=UPI003571EDD6|nr:MAG: hypothetical protein KVP17_002369 [Porospora cf. gigantea B]
MPGSTQRDNKPAGRASFQLSNLIRDGNVVSLFGDDRLHCRYEGYFPLDLRGCYAGKIRLELVASLPRESAPEKLEAALIRQLEAQKQDDLHAAGKQPELLSRDDSVLNSDSGSETQWVQWWVEMKKHVVTGKQHSPFSVPLLFPGPAWEECLRRKETRDRGTQATPRVVDEVREARLDRNPAVLPELFKVGKWTEHGPVEVSSVSERFDKILLPAVKADNFSRPLPNTEDKKSVQLEKLRTTKATSSDGERGAYTQITSESDSANENAPLHHLFDPKGSSIFDQMTEEHLPLMNPSDDLPLMNPSDEEHLPLMNPSDEEHLPRMNPSDNLPLMNPSDEEHLPLMKPINEEHLPLMNPINEEHLPLINPSDREHLLPTQPLFDRSTHDPFSSTAQDWLEFEEAL